VELKAALAGLAARGGSHPSDDEIAAYHAGTLPPADIARVQDHLVGCPECTTLLLGLNDLAQESEPAPPEEIAAAWEGLKKRLPSREPAAKAKPLAPPAIRRRPGAAPPPWLTSLAAALLVAVVGLPSWVVSLRRTVDDLAAPQVNAPLADAFAGPLRGDQEETVVELAPQDRRFNLALHSKDLRTFGDYEAEIVRADGGLVWRGRGLRRNEIGSFVLSLSRRLMPPGQYHARLWGIDGQKRELVGEYDLRVVETTGGR
jgi:hypothetical protein